MTFPGTDISRRLDMAGLWCALGYGVLAYLARQPGEPALAAFLGIVAWTAAPVFGVFFYLRKRDAAPPAARMFLWAAAFRVLGLLGGPIYEDDYFRYLWDAYRFATAGSPYGAAPESFFGDSNIPAEFQGVLDEVNYPELPTIYAPTTQLVFLAAYGLKPASVGALQAILIGIDLLVIALLLRLAPRPAVILYAWCPLVIKEVAFTAHPDGVGVCLLLAAIVLARDKRWPAAAMCLGLAAGAKVFALVLAPLVLARAGRWHWILSGATLAGLYAPFVLTGATQLAALHVFAREWEFNSAVYGLASAALGSPSARVALALVFGAAWTVYAARFAGNPAQAVPRGDWLYGLLLAVSPVVNPWYLLWLLPFATVFPSVWAWTASVAVLLSYVTGLNLQDYQLQPFEQPLWARLTEYGAILIALGIEIRRVRPSTWRERPPTVPQSGGGKPARRGRHPRTARP